MPSVAACFPTAGARATNTSRLTLVARDRHLGSFRINLANGRWADFALADKSARGGDPISLVAYVRNIKQSEAARGLMRMLGMDARQ